VPLSAPDAQPGGEDSDRPVAGIRHTPQRLASGAVARELATGVRAADADFLLNARLIRGRFRDARHPPASGDRAVTLSARSSQPSFCSEFEP